MFRLRHVLTAVAALLCVVALAAQTAAPATAATQQNGAETPKSAVNNAPAATTPNADSASGLRIASGDLLEVSVFGAPDFNNEVRVAEDGTVSLPMVGSIPAAGMSILKFANALKTKLANGGYFNDPQVSVFVKEYATAGVSMLGEVQKPGIYPLLGAHTLYDAISAAGARMP